MKKIRILLICLFLCAGCEQTTNKIQPETDNTVENSSTSFANMKLHRSDLHLTDHQKAIINYFDTAYIPLFDCDDLKQHPTIYQGSQLTFQGAVASILKSDASEYEALLQVYSEKTRIYIRGKQEELPIQEGDWLTIYGRYEGIQDVFVDGAKHSLPMVSVNKCITEYGEPEIKELTQAIFNRDVFIDEEKRGQDHTLDASHSPFERYYKIHLDVENEAFQQLELQVPHPNLRVLNHPQKQLYMSADFKHYIVVDYNSDTNATSMTYLDTDFQPVWHRMIGIGKLTCMDYTADHCAFVVDQNLYWIDMKTGYERMKSMNIGSKTELNIQEDGVVLIGTGKENQIMKVDWDGEVLWKRSVDLDVRDSKGLQEVNHRFVVELIEDKDTTSASKLVAFDHEGNILEELLNRKSQENVELNEKAPCLYYDAKDDVTYMMDGTVRQGNQCMIDE